MRKPCPHGSILPRGLKCSNGYLVIRLYTEHGPYNRGCGKHTKDMEKLAKEKLSEIRREQRLEIFNLPSKAKRIKFKEATEIFQRLHFVEYKDPRTNKPRSSLSISTNQSHLNMLNEFFGSYYFDVITLKDLKRYRRERVEYDEISPGTLNREMAIVSSMYTMFEKWIVEEEIDPVKLPLKNPCLLLSDLHEEPRKRVATLQELKKLKEACHRLNDMALWTVIETEIATSLRLNDLMKLEDAEVIDNQLHLTQGKTGLKISFPASVRPVKWQGLFVNFRTRFERVRREAGLHDLQFRDLRKSGLQLIEDQFTPEQLAIKAGHANVAVTKKWYLKGNIAKQMQPMLAATKKILDSL